MRRLLALTLIAVLILLLSGCEFWMKDDYVSVKPFEVQNVNNEGEIITASSYLDIRQALESFVDSCTQSAVIAVPDLDENTAHYYMKSAISYIQTSYPIGAYAVESVHYEIGTNAGEQAIAVDISYMFNRLELMRIRHVTDTASAALRIQETLEQYGADITLYVANYTEMDFIQMVQDYVDENPQLCMEMPQIVVAVYPKTGKERVLTLSFTYRNSREVLRSMQENVQEIFSYLEAGDGTEMERYTNLYAYLMGLHQYNIETSITPSYSLLRYGVGDSKAFATVYAAMCRRIGLPCQVISGTRNGEAWYWNLISADKTVYHVDLLQSAEAGGFSLQDPALMTGYVWDYSAYPQGRQLS